MGAPLVVPTDSGLVMAGQTEKALSVRGAGPQAFETKGAKNGCPWGKNESGAGDGTRTHGPLLGKHTVLSVVAHIRWAERKASSYGAIIRRGTQETGSG